MPCDAPVWGVWGGRGLGGGAPRPWAAPPPAAANPAPDIARWTDHKNAASPNKPHGSRVIQCDIHL